MPKKILVTGGAGFIGSATVRHLISETDAHVVNLDALTYAGNLESLESVASSPRYAFERADIRDRAALDGIFAKHEPDAVVHLAAESHVDRSIGGPWDFVSTNVVGTYQLLEASRAHLETRPPEARRAFRFVHASTDEVFGDLGADGAYSREDTRYAPSSPYAASKAGSDHLARAWQRTFALPVIVTNCSNNYGPYQFPEKLVPHMILNALAGKELPVYGDGRQVRDWLYVDDHARALWAVLNRGEPGQSYNIGGSNEMRNIDIVEAICALLEELAPRRRGVAPYANLIRFVADRPGHDTRYAVDPAKIETELGWRPQEPFETGLRKTVEWYLSNRDWWQSVLSGSYRLERLGIVGEA